MNKKTSIVIVILVILLGVGFAFYQKNKQEEAVEETSMQTLDRETQDDTTDEIDSDLNSIDVNGSSSEDFENMEIEIRSL